MNKDFYEKYWSGESAAPDNDPTTTDRKAKLRDALASVQPGSPILDLGCGRGEFSSFIRELGFKPTGADLSTTVVDYCRTKHPGITFETMGTPDRLPFKDGSFSAVWSSEVIEHVFDIHAWLSEVNRVLTPKGLVILTTPYHGKLKNVFIALTKFSKHFDPEVSHIRFFDKAGLDRCLCRAGFEPIKWDGIGRFWPLHRTWFVVASRSSEPQSPPEISG